MGINKEIKQTSKKQRTSLKQELPVTRLIWNEPGTARNIKHDSVGDIIKSDKSVSDFIHPQYKPRKVGSESCP